jgi:glycosyltransferase involved in cell wall biosynthesis
MSFQYLKLLCKLNFKIKFLGDDFFPHQPYTSELQKMGIEVLYGIDFQNDWNRWICENGKHFSYVIINRPNIASTYLRDLKANTSCPLIYFGHDLHYLRNIRKYNLLKETTYLIEANNWKKLELEVLSLVDYALYPSSVETDIIRNEFGLNNSKVLPLNIFENDTGSDLIKNDKSKSDLLFVGGFGHDPNVDAVNWFLSDIFPKLKKSIPDLKFHIVGSNPPEQIYNLNSESIIVHGYVADSVLKSLYESCRIVVAPLRYGAGVKGKIIEAIYHRCPVVTTSIGAEGIDNSFSLLTIADNASSFYQEVLNLYTDEVRLDYIFENSPRFIQNNYSFKTIENIINELMP